MTAEELERRVRRLESIEEIRRLAARYAQLVDERRIEEMVELFTPDGRFHHHDGRVDVRGRADLLAYYRGVEQRIGPGFHYLHSHLVELDGDERASGTASGHAELWVEQRLVLIGLRYVDRYAALPGEGWRIADREVMFWYAIPVEELPTAYGDALRRRWPGEPRAAELPHGLPSWRAFWRERRAEGAR